MTTKTLYASPVNLVRFLKLIQPFLKILILDRLLAAYFQLLIQSVIPLRTYRKSVVSAVLEVGLGLRHYEWQK
jgi:hypothetical protein